MSNRPGGLQPEAREVPARPLTVLLVHNRYRERGGEDVAFEAEGRLLEAMGHRVVRHEAHNDDIAETGRLRLAARAVWSREAYRELTRLAAALRPDVAHVHNTLPLLSPSVHHALDAAGVAVVQTLHNYRLLCPQGMLLRGGRPCEECVGRTPPWPGVLYGCYRGSRAATASVAAMLTVHRALGTWTRKVDALIALSAFARERFIAAGLPGERLHVKPNFVDPDPGTGSHKGGFLLYVGRLAQEKGVNTLLEAWRRLSGTGELPSGPRLVVVGDGPLAATVAEAARTLPGLVWEGRQSREQVLALMGEARALVFPSLCYEMSPLVIAEAYARGLPVLGSRWGSTAEMVHEGRTGRLFAPGDAGALAEALRWAVTGEPELARMGHAARSEYEERYAGGANGARLLAVYAAARARRRSPGG